MTEQDRRLAESVRTACLAAARQAYEDAGFSGLCAEGRWEAAQGAMASLDLEDVTISRPHDAAEQKPIASQ